MLKQTNTILAINPGSRYMATALFRGMELREWSTKTFKGRWSKDKFRLILRVINSLIIEHGVNAVVIKGLHPSRTSKELEAIARAMKREALARGIKVYEYSIDQLKKGLDIEKGNKRQLADRIAAEYPFLWVEFNKESSCRNPYYGRLFEAVALGSLCYDELDGRSRANSQKTE